MEELKRKIFDVTEELISESLHDAIGSIGDCFGGHYPEEERAKERRRIFLKRKTEALKKLEDQIDLKLIDEEDAKKEFVRIKFMKEKE